MSQSTENDVETLEEDEVSIADSGSADLVLISTPKFSEESTIDEKIVTFK